MNVPEFRLQAVEAWIPSDGPPKGGTLTADGKAWAGLLTSSPTKPGGASVRASRGGLSERRHSCRRRHGLGRRDVAPPTSANIPADSAGLKARNGIAQGQASSRATPWVNRPPDAQALKGRQKASSLRLFQDLGGASVPASRACAGRGSRVRSPTKMEVLKELRLLGPFCPAPEPARAGATRRRLSNERRYSCKRGSGADVHADTNVGAPSPSLWASSSTGSRPVPRSKKINK